MKHSEHHIGWRVANRHDIPLWKEFCALAACYSLCVGLVVLAVVTMCK
jgi:hypothetical protein